MKIITLQGGVDVGSTLPKFTELFPSLVDPAKIRLADRFASKTAGVLRGQGFDISDAGQVWEGEGGSPNYFIVSPAADSGSVALSQITNTFLYAPMSADGRVYACIRRGVAASFAGVLFRVTDASNWIRVSLSAPGGGIRVDKRVAGVATAIQSIPVALEVGTEYHLGVEFIGDQIVVSLDNVVLATITDADHLSATSVGISGGTPEHRWLEFVAGDA